MTHEEFLQLMAVIRARGHSGGQTPKPLISNTGIASSMRPFPQPSNPTFLDFGWKPSVEQKRQAAALAQDTQQGRTQAETRAYDRLTPGGSVSDISGKLGALPATAVGTLAGLANVGLARLAGHNDARISVGNNALQFEGGLFGTKGAFTLGNSVLYGPGVHPDDAATKRYDERPTSTSIGEHEMGHTYQYQKFGFPALYLARTIANGIMGNRSPYEDEADDFAEESRRGGD